MQLRASHNNALPPCALSLLIAALCHVLQARLRVAVWDDDSLDDGVDDLMGQMLTDVRTASTGAAALPQTCFQLLRSIAKCALNLTRVV